MHYHICEAKSAKVLQLEVTHLIAKGWRPVGGISVANSPNTGVWYYYQAMVLNHEEAVEAFDKTFATSDPEFV